MYNGDLEGDAANGSDDEDEESLERKLARLRREVAEVKEAFRQRRKEATKRQSKDAERQEEAVREKGQDSYETLDSLGQVLESIERPEESDQESSSRRLTRKLNEASQPVESHGTPLLAGPPMNHDTKIDQIVDAQSYEQTHSLHKISDFDKRLRLLENALGMDSIPLPTQDRNAARAVLPVLDSLDRQMSSISVTDSSLDRISRQVRQLTEDTEKLAEARKASAAQVLSNRSSSERHRISKTESGSRAIEDKDHLDQTSKINALYGTLATIESLFPMLPSVLDRLRSLRTIHADAALASEGLSKIEGRQAAMAEELKEWRDGLEKVESAIQNGEMTMKSNMDVVERWVKELEKRLQNGPSTGNL